MKPLIKYRGEIKRNTYLIKHIPKYEGRYIEPFFAEVHCFYLEPRAIINDIN